ncbi:hypothetical protein Patl1_15101 [Pistacia atlantica]|uniref:Uncharacterized protein n=1 Tax=Pistacia atlantica TaxID=434234 RepID=A0ACC1B5P6_9ROSI|nr:hypothetical protein Patl1_15101 [Pistacia atlantica]
MCRESAAPGRFFDILGGGGNVANIVLWKNKALSAGILIGVTIICLEILNSANCDYLFFIFRRTPHRIDEFNLSESTCAFLFGNLSWLLIKFYDISSGNDFRLFFLLSGVSYISVRRRTFLPCSVIFFSRNEPNWDCVFVSGIKVFLCLETLPAISVRFQGEVDYLAGKSTQDMKKLFQDFNSKVLDRIPRAPTKEKK